MSPRQFLGSLAGIIFLAVNAGIMFNLKEYGWALTSSLGCIAFSIIIAANIIRSS